MENKSNTEKLKDESSIETLDKKDDQNNKDGKSDDDQKFCSNCKKFLKKSFLCGNCKKKRYCGRECQVAHWKSGHKSECFASAIHNQKDYIHFNPRLEELKYIKELGTGNFSVKNMLISLENRSGRRQENWRDISS